MKTSVYVQARMRSTRLPGKVLKEIKKRPLLDYLIERLQQAKEVEEIVVLTSTHPADDAIVYFCQSRKISYFRGSEENVLERYYKAAKKMHPALIVRVTADCPLLDPDILDQAIIQFKKMHPAVDYLSNTLELTFPRGLDVEIFPFATLEKAYHLATLPEEKEHVTPYIYRHPAIFQLANLACPFSYECHRWTVDTIEDFQLIERIVIALYPINPYFRLQDIIQLLDQHPEWSLLNQNVKQKTI